MVPDGIKMFVIGIVIAIAVSIALYRIVYVPRDVSRRRLYARYSYEEELLRNNSVRHEEEYVTINNRTLYRQVWTPLNPPLRAIVVFIHGLNAYSGKFAQWVHVFSKEGFIVLTFDHYGHGRSDGLHGYVPSVDGMVEDVQHHITQFSNSEGMSHLPIFTLGISMGGLVQLMHSLKYPETIRGMVCMCPLVYPTGGVTPSPFVQAIGRSIRSLLPEIGLKPGNKGKGFVDKEKQKIDEEDPRAYHGWLRVGTGFALLEGFMSMQRRLSEVSVPFLLFHGTLDDVVDVKGSRELHDKAVSIDKTYVELPESSHVLFEEPLKISEPMFGSIVHWISSRV